MQTEWIVIVVLVVIAIYAIVVFNRLIRGRNLVREGWSGIDVQLRRRSDLIPNLVEIVKGYAAHERTLFEDIAAKRTSAMAKASSVSERLRVIGSRTEMPAIYSACDVVVLVSDDIETFPLCFLEAEACGVPVVGLDTGGVRETMIAGETGFVVDSDNLEGMTSTLAALLADRDKRLRMGRAGRQWVKRKLSRDAMVDGYERVLTGGKAAGHSER